MPDGFDPHKELARIDTLRELMQECRSFAGEMIDELKLLIHNEDPDIQLRAIQMALDRGFGKPRQHVMINDSTTADSSRVVVVLPDNGRSVTNGKIIDA